MAQIGRARTFRDGFDIDAAMKNARKNYGAGGDTIADVKLVLDVIDQKILKRAHISIDKALKAEPDEFLREGKMYTGVSIPATEKLANIINKVSCELECKCSGEGNAQATTDAILKILENYSWDAKAVITLAAFAMNYGEFCLFAQLTLIHPLAQYVASLKHLTHIAEHGSTHQHLFGSLKELIGAIVDLAKCMDGFGDLNHKYVSEDKPPLSNAMAMIHEPACWIIFSVVVCTEQIASLAGVSTESTSSYSVPNLTVRVKQVLKVLQTHLDECSSYIEKEECKENYERIKRFFENAPSQEEILRTIFNWDRSILIHCSGNKEVFQQKTVLILISGLDISTNEITALGQFYKMWQKQGKSELQTQVIWLPVKESGTNWDKCIHKFKELRKSMPWYTIEDPSSIKEEVVSYIKQEWEYSGKAILVALDSSGKVQSKNALDMLWTWGETFLDFTEREELSLWQKSTNILELIFGRTGHTIDFNSVIKGTTIVCFYGGEDIEWIRKFTEEAKKILDKASIKIKQTYIGKSTSLERVKQNIREITEKKMSQTWDETSIWLFWTRLKSILHSNTRIGSDIKKTLLPEITTLLNFDANETGWAVFCSTSSKLNKARGADALTVLDTLAKNPQWVDETFNKKQCHLFFHEHEIQGGVPCGCGRTMKKSYVYKCCHGDH